MLSFDRRLPFGWKAFLALAKGNIKERDYRNLASLEMAGGGSSPFAREWGRFYGEFEEALAQGRARARGLSPQGKAGRAASDQGVASCVAEALALSRENPLKAELLMLRFLFARADEMAGLELFGERALMAYAVKLLILARRSRFSAIGGEAERERLFSNMRSVFSDTNG